MVNNDTGRRLENIIVYFYEEKFNSFINKVKIMFYDAMDILINA